MKSIVCLALLFLSSNALATGTFSGICHGSGFTGLPFTMTIQSSFSSVRNEYGPSAIKVTKDSDSSVIIDLNDTKQVWMHETEQGVTSFGIFSDSNYHDTAQTVYVQLAYDNLGLLESLRQMQRGTIDKNHLMAQDVVFQVFGDKYSFALTVRFKCDFALGADVQ